MSDNLSILTVQELLLAYRRIKFEPHNRGVEKLNAYVEEAQRRDTTIAQFYAKIVELQAEIAGLKAQLAQRPSWEPVPDGDYEVGAYYGDMLTVEDEWLKLLDRTYPFDVRVVAFELPDDMRLCRRVANEAKGEEVTNGE